MKKLLLSVLVLFSAYTVYSQDEKEVAKYQKKVASSDEDIQNEKKKTNPKTWISRGELFTEIYDIPLKNVQLGLSQADIGILLHDQTTIGTEFMTIGEENLTVSVYNNKKLVFGKDGSVLGWEVTDKIAPKPLQTAFDAYMEAIKVDEKAGVGNKKMKDGLINLANRFKSQGISSYQLTNFADALANFKQSLACSSNPVVGITDSMLIYYSGVAANNLRDYTTAEEYFNKAIQIGYVEGGNTYAMLATVQRDGGKKDVAEQTLKTALLKYPSNNNIVLSLIDFYIHSGENPNKVLPLIEQAKAADPKNSQLDCAEGNIYEKLAAATNNVKELDRADECYQRAITKDANNFYAYYSLGVVRYNKGAHYHNEANNLGPNASAEYDRLTKLAEKEFESAIEPALKAYEFRPEDKSTVQTLKEIYFRLKQKGDEYKKNYEKFDELFKAM